MAVRGAKPKPPELKLITGKRAEVSQSDIKFRKEPLQPPRKLTKAQQRLWERFIDTAWWLTDHDVPKAYAWVCLEAEFEKSPSNMVAARITQLRVFGSELGFDPSARVRMGTSGDKRTDPADKFFD